MTMHSMTRRVTIAAIAAISMIGGPALAGEHQVLVPGMRSTASLP